MQPASKKKMRSCVSPITHSFGTVLQVGTPTPPEAGVIRWLQSGARGPLLKLLTNPRCSGLDCFDLHGYLTLWCDNIGLNFGVKVGLS